MFTLPSLPSGFQMRFMLLEVVVSSFPSGVFLGLYPPGLGPHSSHLGLCMAAAPLLPTGTRLWSPQDSCTATAWRVTCGQS